jgi:hypothetical protein
MSAGKGSMTQSLIRSFVITIFAGLLSESLLLAQEVSQGIKTPTSISTPHLEDWMLDFNRNSLPMLSQKGKEFSQFQIVVQALEKYRGNRLSSEEVSAIFVRMLRSVQECRAHDGIGIDCN